MSFLLWSLQKLILKVARRDVPPVVWLDMNQVQKEYNKICLPGRRFVLTKNQEDEIMTSDYTGPDNIQDENNKEIRESNRVTDTSTDQSKDTIEKEGPE